MKRKWKKVLLMGAVGCAAGGFVFVQVAFREASLGLGETAPLDQTLAFTSFSEVENAKALMQELADRFLEEVRTARAKSYVENGSGNEVVRRAELTKATKRLLEGLREFEGTAQETKVTREVLQTLTSSGQVSDWMDVYLSFVYRNPTDELVSKLARDAVEVAAQLEREKELAAALEHVARIPISFGGKETLASLLAENGGMARFASDPHSSAARTDRGGVL